MKDKEYLKKFTIQNPVDWIHGSRAPVNSVPCEITFNMQGPIYLGHPWINFDSLLMYCVLEDILGDKIVNLPNKNPIDLKNLELPLKETLGINHSSISFFDGKIEVLNQNDFRLDMIYKRFEGKDTNYLKHAKRKGKIRMGSGKFRNFWLRLPYITPKTVTFYAHSNVETLNYLLEYIHSLGLKQSINALNVKNIKVKEINEDKSLEYQGKAMRPLPCKKYGAGYKNINLGYKPPYWDKNNVELCIFPCSELLV